MAFLSVLRNLGGKRFAGGQTAIGVVAPLATPLLARLRVLVAASLAALVVFAALAWDLGQRSGRTSASAAGATAAVWPAGVALPPNPDASFQRIAQGHVPMPEGTPAAHASSLVAMPSTSAASVLAFWFAGERESAPDVQIALSWFDRAQQRWQPARFVVNRGAVGAQLGFGVRRLGNPVAWRDSAGHVHLFVVATGLGGWAAGRVLHLKQKGPPAQDGRALSAMKFDAVRVLPLSWLWNTSFLARNAPLALADGGMLLPLYFELGIKTPVAARFGATGEFLGLQRISGRRHLLQPSLVMQDESRWLALMRDQGPEHRVAVAVTDDAGQHWHDQPSLALPNPDAAVAGLGLGPGLMVLAYNPAAQGRESLALSASANGRDWRTVAALAEGGRGSEFSYPALTWSDDSLWVSYTDGRRRIAWQRWTLTPAGSGAAR